MIYADEAVEQFRTHFDSIGLTYQIKQMDEKDFQFVITKNGVDISCWFDVSKQIYGFDMIQGGCKTYSSFEEFTEFFETYIAIYTEFIPNAKVVSDVFEQDINVQSVYDNFTGNKQNGYIAKFRVLGSKNNGILITKCSEGYSAKYIEYSEDGSKYKIISEYKYELDDVQNVTKLPTISSYIDELSKKYKDDNVAIHRTGIDTFSFNIEGLQIVAKVEFVYTSLIYHILQVDSYDVTSTEFDFECQFQPEDCYNLSELYMYCADFAKDMQAASEETEEVEESAEEVDEASESEDSEEIIEKVEELDETSEDFSDDSEEVNKSVEEHITSEDIDEVLEDVKQSIEEAEEIIESEEPVETIDDVQEVEESVEESESTDTTEESIKNDATEVEQEQISTELIQEMEINTMDKHEFSVKVARHDGEVMYIQFAGVDGVYVMSTKKAESLGIPANRITDEIHTVIKHGIAMTEEEIKFKKFTVDISNDDEMCNKIYNAIFE